MSFGTAGDIILKSILGRCGKTPCIYDFRRETGPVEPHCISCLVVESFFGTSFKGEGSMRRRSGIIPFSHIHNEQRKRKLTDQLEPPLYSIGRAPFKTSRLASAAASAACSALYEFLGSKRLNGSLLDPSLANHLCRLTCSMV